MIPDILHSFKAPTMDDVKESVRQGVTKVAGRLSGMASGVMNQIQVRYHTGSLLVFLLTISLFLYRELNRLTNCSLW